MRVLLISPIFPKTFWSFEGVLKLVGRKALIPPLGLATVAALLPQDWQFRLIDRNVDALGEADWAWADLVMLSGMIVQKDDMLSLIAEAGRRDKAIVVGGPYVTSVPDEAIAAGADYMVLDEGELTIPPFVDEILAHGVRRRETGAPARIFRAKDAKPDMTTTPVARFDLFNLDAYDAMAIQYSRGCPFLCEFCDIITLYGRRPRAKTPEQVLAELQRLYDLGWRRGIFLVDDNFIGNKRNVKVLLEHLEVWQRERNYPFWFDTEASIDLAADPELLAAMVRCHFASVFIGIETPDSESLELTRKHQNNRRSMEESIALITRAGLRVMCGMILGFDNERRGAGDRILRFVETTAVPTVILSMLQALPNTGLWDRLAREGRLHDTTANINQTTALNFVPTRPVGEITDEFIASFRALYEPLPYLRRVYRHIMELGEDTPPQPKTSSSHKDPLPWSHRVRRGLVENAYILRAFAIVCWRQGVVRETRGAFWRQMVSVARRKPQYFTLYLALCAQNEHFLEYRDLVTREIQAQVLDRREEVFVKPVIEPHTSVSAA